MAESIDGVFYFPPHSKSHFSEASLSLHPSLTEGYSATPSICCPLMSDNTLIHMLSLTTGYVTQTPVPDAQPSPEYVYQQWSIAPVG